MNLFEIFNEEEIGKVLNVVGTLEDRIYTKDEWSKMKNTVLNDIMSNSSKNGDLDRARNNFNTALSKSETCIGGENG
jgi:hypothetical protein